MANLVFDFLHHYQRGERRESDPANAYQYDEGHVIEAVLPETVTSVELHYWTRGMEEAEAYTPSSITANDDESCTVIGSVPNKFFETDGDLRVYIVVNDAEASITTYEGKIHVVHRAMPDDYVDEDPDNPATRILAEAQAAATTATQQAQAASASAGQAAQSAQTLSGSVTQIATNTQDITALKEDKADIDGYYEDMTVGDAEQLVASQYVEDSVPYLFRTTGGSADVGNREYVEGIVGGSIVWNQLANSSITSLSNNGVTFTHNNGKWDISGTATGRVQTTVIFDRFNTIAGHKYFMGISKDIAPFRIRENNGSLQQTATSKVLACTEGKLTYFTFDSTTDISETSVDIKDVYIMVTDLTQMFGSTIADYVYGLETATAGAGVSWLKKHFPKIFDAGYIPYNPGELLSVSGLASHNTVGFNQWDEEWEVGGIDSSTGDNISGLTGIRSKNYISVFPDVTYYNYVGSSTGDNFQTRFYDADKNYIGYVQRNGNPVLKNSTFVIPSNAHYMRFQMQAAYGTTYNHDICINLSWSGWRNGEYEAYQKHSYPLDDSLTLRGIPKLDAQNNLYYDGDEYLPDGTVNRRYGVVDLGTLTWEKPSTATRYRARIVGMVSTTYPNRITNFILSNGKYTKVTIDSGVDATMLCDNGWISIYDEAYETASDFKAAMSNVYLLYPLATPTTETAEPYQHVQICDDFGTEEYVSTSIVPVGHNTRYPANLRDKLQHLPDLADDDGYYMIGQSNKQMHLELFRIPKAPTSPDGTYTLKATVSGGTPTYTWEVQT